ncbi:hypothetical protein ACJJIQ_09630 [Microbulbifer sp. ANSA003]|uniref:hypothetical protein n=1 Tax=unclassified Microbulbifer TaxID=2619833 RepID=UPI0040395275
MKATLKTKSGMLYEVWLEDISVLPGMNAFPGQGIVELDPIAIDQLADDAKTYGSWRSAMEVSLSLYVNGELCAFEILLEDIPVQEKVKFVTTKVLEIV